MKQLQSYYCDARHHDELGVSMISYSNAFRTASRNTTG